MLPQRRCQQDVGVREARRGVAGHAEDQRRQPMSAERRRLAGLHRDAVEQHLALLLDDVEHQVALADRAAAREHQHVVARGTSSTARERSSIVSAAVRIGTGTPPCSATTADSVNGVDVVDLARRQRPPGFDDLVAGREDGDARAGVDVDLRAGRARPGRRAAGVQQRARLAAPLAAADVGALAADVLLRLHAGEDLDDAAPSSSVSSTMTTASAPAGIGRAGRDLRALPGSHGCARHLPGEDLLDAGAARAATLRRRAAACRPRARRSRPWRRARTAARRGRDDLARPARGRARRAARPLDSRRSSGTTVRSMIARASSSGDRGLERPHLHACRRFSSLVAAAARRVRAPAGSAWSSPGAPRSPNRAARRSPSARPCRRWRGSSSRRCRCRRS